jgi:RNA polymerase sigma-70 factor (ECF subfamily)
VLLLIALEDYSYAETARLLGIPLGTVMSRLARARENPRAILAEDARPARLRIVT